ncbi:YjeO family protein [Superficieibacter sp. HKU1]|uniref:YjeO family protein n=1 Tax=Superficieibacter sp. HKU1 TaxID=3031919 RepID=UPI0023E2F726|nr:YjeO family protein [Superficieibacter sp. HKU1]WES67992.1 YjeO family protein [Superficieibacter sp. HKU1]
MSWKSFAINMIWLLLCVILITLFSTQDKEWFIDGSDIKNICDVMEYIENDDVRLVGVALTIPLFFPFIYVIIWRKQRSLWQYSVAVVLLVFWLWRFIFRYYLC